MDSAKELYPTKNDIIQEYKTELGKALELSSIGTYTCTLTLNNIFLIIKKDSEDISITILGKTLLEELALDSSLPDILSTIADSMSRFHSETHEKDETIRRLAKGDIHSFLFPSQFYLIYIYWY